jgi:antirestriction protein ArdC
MSFDRFDIHQHVTDQIIAMIDQAKGDFRLPWHTPRSNTRPLNIASGKPYQGVNILALWAEAEKRGYGSGLWGTYRQWAALGAQVRKGEKSAYIVFYKEAAASRHPAAADDAAQNAEPVRRLVTRASAVFAVEQVDGYNLPEAPPRDPVIADARAEAFVAATRAKIIHEGRRAFYRPSTDTIYMPPRSVFIGTSTSSPTEAYYSTLFHELTHYAGHETRCNRQLGKRFGEHAHAMEELVAELGAAFLCADLQITCAPRIDHAQYLAHWLAVLRHDKRAIFSAASKASEAVAFLSAVQPLSRNESSRSGAEALPESASALNVSALVASL